MRAVSFVYPELAALLIKLRDKVYTLLRDHRDVDEALSSIEWIKIDEESIDATACRAVVAADSSFILFESRLAMIYALQGRA